MRFSYRRRLSLARRKPASIALSTWRVTSAARPGFIASKSLGKLVIYLSPGVQITGCAGLSLHP